MLLEKFVPPYDTELKWEVISQRIRECARVQVIEHGLGSSFTIQVSIATPPLHIYLILSARSLFLRMIQLVAFLHFPWLYHSLKLHSLILSSTFDH